MKVAKKGRAAPRPVVISSLAAKVLGHSRVTNIPTFSIQHLSITFPAFNTQELSNAMSELLDKHLMEHKGNEERAVYRLTDYGREGRVAVA